MSEASRWKAQIRAHLAAVRSSLLSQLLGLPASVLEGECVDGDLTPVQVLSLISHEDEARAAAIEQVLAGSDVEADWAEHNPETKVLLSVALEQFLSARARLLSALARVPDDDLFRPLTEGGATVAQWVEECLEHDEISADRLAEWRGSREQPDEVGPDDILVAGMRAARKELLTTIALIPGDKRSGWSLGTRSLADALRELSRWEQKLLVALTDGEGAQAGSSPTEDSWEETWRTLHDTHHALVRMVERLPELELARTFADLWLHGQGIHDLFRIAVVQDRHVAAALRTSLEVNSPGSRAAP